MCIRDSLYPRDLASREVAGEEGVMAVTSEQTLTSEHRTAFWALADVLIPATDDMPAASQAGSAEKWLDRALAARPDLVAPLAALLDEAAGRDPEAEVRRLHAENPD